MPSALASLRMVRGWGVEISGKGKILTNYRWEKRA
jgi:hypothetical protein